MCEFDTTPIAATKWVMSLRNKYPSPTIGQQLFEEALSLLLSFAKKGTLTACHDGAVCAVTTGLGSCMDMDAHARYAHEPRP